jgi:hypothetical protein
VAGAATMDLPMARRPRCQPFNLTPGRKIGSRYRVEYLLGRGSEGEVYQVREEGTDIRRAAKLYFPDRDPKNRLMLRHAQKLHALRHCPIVLQYHHSELVRVRGRRVVALVSELCEGQQLERWIARHRGKRLRPYRALCVLHQLVRGLEAIHALGEYHADVHSQNILIRPTGVRFDIKLVDFYDWGRPTRYKQQQDVMDCVRLLHELIGGRRHYASMPEEVRHICAGLRSTLVLKRFATMTRLRKHLETFEWQGMLSPVASS